MCRMGITSWLVVPGGVGVVGGAAWSRRSGSVARAGAGGAAGGGASATVGSEALALAGKSVCTDVGVARLAGGCGVGGMGVAR